MTRSAYALLPVLCPLVLCSSLFYGCAGCPPHMRAHHGPAVTSELKAKRETLKAQRADASRAFAAEAANQRGIAEKSGRYEYLRAEIGRLDGEIRSIDCEIGPR